MYTSWNFKKDKELAVKDLDQLQEEISKNRQFELTTHNIEDLEIRDGRISNGEEHQITKRGFRDYCNILSIPDPFAKRIPEDLLYHNIDTLKVRMSGEPVVLVHDPADGGVVRINKAPFTPSPVIEIINRIRKMDIEPTSIKLDFDKINIMSVNKKFGEIMADSNDPSMLALMLRCSDTTAKPIIGRSGLYRMICSNGTILGQDFGYIRARIKAERDPETIMNTFFEQIDNMEIQMEKIKGKLIRMTEVQLTDRSVVKIWDKVKKHTGSPEIADLCLHIDEESRKALRSMVKARDAQIKLGTFRKNNIDIEDRPFGGNVYEVYNNITNRAKTYDLNTQIKLETVGGELFELDCLN